MADLHILDGDGERVRVICHIPIPNIVNDVSVNYRTALVNSGIGGTTILKDGDGTNGTISAAEKASIAAGSLYETVIEVAPNTAATAGARLAYLDAQYNATVARVQMELQARLRYYGLAREVP